MKWTPNTGPLDRGVFVNALPISTEGGATIPDQFGHRFQETFAETTRGDSPSLAEDALGTFVNGPRQLCPRPRPKLKLVIARSGDRQVGGPT
jgi:hypothetical protein